MPTRRLLALAALGLAAAACSSDNPVKVEDPIACEHVDADGLAVERGDSTLAAQWQAAVAGELRLGAGPSVVEVTVTFLGADSARLAVGPECPDHALRWEIADTTIAQAVATGRWSLGLRGKSAGSTTVRFRLWHGDHADFTSQPFPIAVEPGVVHQPIGADGVTLFSGCSRISSWNLGVAGGYGKLVARLGHTTSPIGAQFIDATDAVVDPADPGYELALTVADPAIARADPVPGERFGFRIAGLAPGHTTLTVGLRWNGVIEWISGALDVVVHDTSAAALAAESFLIKKSGVRHAFVRDGALVASCGAATATGFLPARLDTIEDLFQFRLLDFASCSETRPSASLYSLTYEFADPCVAGVVAHPEHPGEHFEFHLRGLAAGETTMRLRLMSGNRVAFESPPLRVVVRGSTSAARPSRG